MRAADVFASPSTREGFGLTFAEAMAADCTVIAADHPDSAADEVIGDAGFLVDPTVEALTETLDRALRGDRPSTNPVERAQRYDWDTVADQAATAYRRAITDLGESIRSRIRPVRRGLERSHLGIGQHQAVALLGDVGLDDQPSGEPRLRGAERRCRDLVKVIHQI